MRRNPAFLIRILVAVVLTTLGGSLRDAHAGKDHCRTLEFAGAAGHASQDYVELQVTDYLGNVVDRNCQVQAEADECADAFAARIVSQWGSGTEDGSFECPAQELKQTCGKNLNLTPVSGYDPDDAGFRIFCKHKYKPGKVVGGKKAIEELGPDACPQPPSGEQSAQRGELKKLPKIEICCYELPADFNVNDFNYADPTTCKGKKLGSTLTNRIEISVHDRVNHPNVPGSGIFFDPRDDSNQTIVPVGDTSRQIALDPISLHQLPTPTGARCRAAVARAASALDATVIDIMVECHLAPPPDVECNDLGRVMADSRYLAASQAILESLTVDCADGDFLVPRISPATYGLGSCPFPCGVPTTCSAGSVDSPCSFDRQCDTQPGQGDGRCGKWEEGAWCVECLQFLGTALPVMTVFNATPPPASPAQPCLAALAESLAQLSSTYSKEMLACQKKADGGRNVTADVFCKNIDPRGKRQAAELKIGAMLASSCEGVDLSGLAICPGQNTTVDELKQCIIDAVTDVTTFLSAGAFPETYTVCGNNKLEKGEECDLSDDGACQGLCQSDCTCPDPVCGNNVTEAGEECDGTSKWSCPNSECDTLTCTCGPPAVSVLEDLRPCDYPNGIDRYRFKVNANDNVSLSADTRDTATAANLGFHFGSGCNNGDPIYGDEDMPCTFPAGDHQCPQTSFVASADGTCTVEVTAFTGDCIDCCTDPSRANYTLVVTANGNPVALTMYDDDELLGTPFGGLCGDGVLAPEIGEMCDYPADWYCPDRCLTNCACEQVSCAGGSPNGVIQQGEQCDDGNLNPCDSCTNGCHLTGSYDIQSCVNAGLRTEAIP